MEDNAIAHAGWDISFHRQLDRVTHRELLTTRGLLILRWIPVRVVAFTDGHRGMVLDYEPFRADLFENIRRLDSAHDRDRIARVDDVFHAAHPGHPVGWVHRDIGDGELDLLGIAENRHPALFDGR